MSLINEANQEINKFFNEERETQKRQIAEGGLSRILAHVKNDNKTFGMISAYRHENTPAENNKQTMLLTHDLISMKLGFIKMEGGYIETVSQDTPIEDGVVPDGVQVKERSFFVGNLTKEQAMELCAKYNQDSVLFKDKDGLRYIDKDGNNVSEVFMDIIVDNDFVLNKIKDFFSRRLQGGNKRNFFKFKETFYVGIQNWKWARHTISQYDDVEKSDNYTDIKTL